MYTRLLLVGLLAMSGAVIARAQTMPVTVEELTVVSTDVVVGRTISSRALWNPDRTMILTEITIRVEERLKGDGPTETVITVPGGRVGNLAYEVSDMPAFVEDEEVVVFLWIAPTGETLVVGGAQGRLQVVEEQGVKTVVGAPAWSPNRSSPPLSLRVGGETSIVRTVPLADLTAQVRNFADAQ